MKDHVEGAKLADSYTDLCKGAVGYMKAMEEYNPALMNAVGKWLKDNNHNPEYIQALREDFIEEHHAELYDYTVTLCHKHHLKLHSIYGKDPALTTAKKQMRWVEIQREKHGMV